MVKRGQRRPGIAKGLRDIIRAKHKVVNTGARMFLSDRLLDKAIVRRASSIASRAGRNNINANDLRVAMFQLSKASRHTRRGKTKATKRLASNIIRGLKRVPAGYRVISANRRRAKERSRANKRRAESPTY